MLTFKERFGNFVLKPGFEPEERKNVPEMEEVGLSLDIISAICGSLFGDCSISKSGPYSNARISVSHSSRQEEYFS
jgi:hypothetical protein